MSLLTLLGAAGVAVQVLTPNLDVSDGAWTGQDGGLDLFTYIDEDAAIDSDYIRSSTSPATADVAEVHLSDVTDPQSSADHKVSYRYGKDIAGGHRIDLTVSLMQGTTVIASWTHADIPATLTSVTQTLSTAQADSITNYNDLRLRFSAIKV